MQLHKWNWIELKQCDYIAFHSWWNLLLSLVFSYCYALLGKLSTMRSNKPYANSLLIQNRNRFKFYTLLWNYSYDGLCSVKNKLPFNYYRSIIVIDFIGEIGPTLQFIVQLNCAWTKTMHCIYISYYWWYYSNCFWSSLAFCPNDNS